MASAGLLKEERVSWSGWQPLMLSIAAAALFVLPLPTLLMCVAVAIALGVRAHLGENYCIDSNACDAMLASAFACNMCTWRIADPAHVVRFCLSHREEVEQQIQQHIPGLVQGCCNSFRAAAIAHGCPHQEGSRLDA